MTSRFPEIWARGLPDRQKLEFENTLLSSPVIDRLKTILEDMKRSLTVHSKDYDNPGWVAKQAHQNGLYEAYEQIERLLTPLDRKD